MNSKIKILFFILSTCRNIACSTLATQPASEYDVTEALRNSINSLFRNVEEETFGKIIKEMECHNTSIDLQLGNDITLKDLYVWITRSSRRKLYCDFSNYEMSLTIGHLKTAIDTLSRKNNKAGYLLFAIVNFYNISVNASRSSMDVSYSKANTSLNINRKQSEIFWLGEGAKKSLEYVLPKLVHGMMNSSHKFVSALISLFLQPKKDIIHTIPDFFDLENKYYYYIPNVRFQFFNLKNIRIRGLSNFQSFKSNDQLGDLVHTLTMENIRGNFTLDYKSKNQTISKPLEMDFTADYLDISVDSEERRVNVQAQDFRVVLSESDTPLTYDQSAIMMHHIESAIATSILPFIKVWWNDNQPSNRYNNEDQVRRILDRIMSKKGPYDYQISFHNVTVKLISGFLYPQQIHCEFPNNLNITHRINAKPTGNLRFNDEEDSAIDINFHVNFTSISFSVVNPNNSKENDTCEFQIHPNKDFQVEFSHSENINSSSIDELKMKEKIDQTLISMENQGFISYVKTVLCSPVNFCAKSAKLFDDYVLSFLKNLLEKCSLRRNTTST